MKWFKRIIGRAPIRPTESELLVLRKILDGGDPRLGLLVQQLEQAPEIIREYPGGNRFRVGPTSTFDRLSFLLEVDRLESGWLPVRDANSGRELEFRVVLGRHGFLHGLEGRTVDEGPWPTEWTAGPPPSAGTTGPLLVLPSEEEQRELDQLARARLADWLGVPIKADVFLYPPATDAAIAARELSMDGGFPIGFRTLLGITDGIEAGDIRIYGHRDVYEIEHETIPALVVAWDSDDEDDFVVVLSRDGRDETVYRIDIHHPKVQPASIAADFGSYLRPYVAAEQRTGTRFRTRSG